MTLYVVRDDRQGLNSAGRALARTGVEVPKREGAILALVPLRGKLTKRTAGRFAGSEVEALCIGAGALGISRADPRLSELRVFVPCL